MSHGRESSTLQVLDPAPLVQEEIPSTLIADPVEILLCLGRWRTLGSRHLPRLLEPLERALAGTERGNLQAKPEGHYRSAALVGEGSDKRIKLLTFVKRAIGLVQRRQPSCRQRQQRRPFDFREYFADLLARRPVDARVGHRRLPMEQEAVLVVSQGGLMRTAKMITSPDASGPTRPRGLACRRQRPWRACRALAAPPRWQPGPAL